jgi:hypothetical protein
VDVPRTCMQKNQHSNMYQCLQVHMLDGVSSFFLPQKSTYAEYV